VVRAFELLVAIAKLAFNSVQALFTWDTTALLDGIDEYSKTVDDINKRSKQAKTDREKGWEEIVAKIQTEPTKPGVNSIAKAATAPVVTSTKADAAKVTVGIGNPATMASNPAVSTQTALGYSTAATTQEGAAVKQTTAAEQNLMAAQANKEAAMANQQASIVFKAGADRLASAPTPSASYSFMPPSLGNQGR
jgi:hypothetical protein